MPAQGPKKLVITKKLPAKKNNCLIVPYRLESLFRCPYNLKEVHEWGVKWDVLRVVPNEGDETEEFEAYMGSEGFDFKYPDVGYEICEEEDIDYSGDTEDEEEICPSCGMNGCPNEDEIERKYKLKQVHIELVSHIFKEPAINDK